MSQPAKRARTNLNLEQKIKLIDEAKNKPHSQVAKDFYRLEKCVIDSYSCKLKQTSISDFLRNKFVEFYICLH